MSDLAHVIPIGSFVTPGNGPNPDGEPAAAQDPPTRAHARAVLLARRARARRQSGAARWLTTRREGIAESAEAGLATAEYAIATVAAAGFAGLLITVLRSNTVRGLLASIIESALSIS